MSVSERGTVLLATAVIIVALCLFTGFVIDTGMLQQQRGQAQIAADAAAVAGAMQMTPGQNSAWAANAATNAAAWNGFRNESATKVAVMRSNAARTVHVEITRNVPTYFMNILGIHSMPVTASATGGIGRDGNRAVLVQ